MLASHRDEVTLPEDVDASGDSTQKVRESVEALSNTVGVDQNEGSHSSRQGVREQLIAVGLADEAEQEGLHGNLGLLNTLSGYGKGLSPCTVGFH